MNRIYPVNPVIPSKNETSRFEIMEIYEPCYNISKFYYPAHQIYNYASGVVRKYQFRADKHPGKIVCSDRGQESAFPEFMRDMQYSHKPEALVPGVRKRGPLR